MKKHVLGESFLAAAKRNDKLKVSLLLQKGVDVNYANREGWTGLYLACIAGSDSVVELLLAHPQINVNQRTNEGETAFLRACCNGRVQVVRRMLEDPRVDINMGNRSGTTPLWMAADFGRKEVVEWIIASGRELQRQALGRVLSSDMFLTPLQTASKNVMNEEIADLLHHLDHDELDTRIRLQIRLNISESIAAVVFAFLVYSSDHYFCLKSKELLLTDDEQRWARFVGIGLKLPMELQMVLANRLANSSSDLVLTKFSEPAFKWIFKTCFVKTA
jgi:hypothetical protein